MQTTNTIKIKLIKDPHDFKKFWFLHKKNEIKVDPKVIRDQLNEKTGLGFKINRNVSNMAELLTGELPRKVRQKWMGREITIEIPGSSS